jgi:hypothetical protein
LKPKAASEASKSKERLTDTRKESHSRENLKEKEPATTTPPSISHPPERPKHSPPQTHVPHGESFEKMASPRLVLTSATAHLSVHASSSEGKLQVPTELTRTSPRESTEAVLPESPRDDEKKAPSRPKTHVPESVPEHHEHHHQASVSEHSTSEQPHSDASESNTNNSSNTASSTEQPTAHKAAREGRDKPKRPKTKSPDAAGHSAPRSHKSTTALKSLGDEVRIELWIYFIYFIFL